MKTKTIFLSLFLMLASMGAWAQEKFENAVLTIHTMQPLYVGSQATIYLMTADSMQFVKLEKNENYEAKYLQKLDELSAKGWEIIEVSNAWMSSSGPSSGPLLTKYYLRKKKN